MAEKLNKARLDLKGKMSCRYFLPPATMFSLPELWQQTIFAWLGVRDSFEWGQDFFGFLASQKNLLSNPSQFTGDKCQGAALLKLPTLFSCIDFLATALELAQLMTAWGGQKSKNTAAFD